MAFGERTYVLAYDVSDDDRRGRLCALLESRGRRVQYSVFEVISTRGEIDELLAAAVEPSRFDSSFDSLRCYPLCVTCRRDARVRGVSDLVTEPGRPIVL